MASFAITSYSTTARTLNNGETGFIGVNGALNVASGTAVIGSGGLIKANILGSVTATSGTAINHDGSDFFVTVGQTGHVISGNLDAIDATITGSGMITNFGVISGFSRAMDLAAGDASSNWRVFNHGHLNGRDTAVRLVTGNGAAFLENTGQITSASTAIAANNIANSYQTTLINSGTISGSTAFLGSSASDRITNSGTIKGSLDLGEGNDSMTSTGGVITGNVYGDDGRDSIKLNNTTFDGIVDGGAGNDYLDVRNSDFTGLLRGSLGDDIFVIDDGNIVLSESPDHGTDVVMSYASFTLPDNVENLTLLGGRANDGIGNNAKNEITGNGHDNTLRGRGGDDDLTGNSGDDLLAGNAGNDDMKGGEDNDTLLGGRGADKVIGGDGDDRLTGHSGADRLFGGSGDDVLTGGTGRDDFIFVDGTDGFGRDVIRDFDARADAEDISLKGVASIRNFNDLSNNHMTQVGGNVKIDAGGGNTILLQGVSLAHLDAEDFLF